jgi:hypothetical protein
MQNFIQKQIIFSVFMSVAAVASASTPDKTLSVVPPMRQLPKPTVSYNTPSPLFSTQNGMSPEELEYSIGRVAPCNSPLSINEINESEMLTIRVLNNSPEWLEALKEDDLNKQAVAISAFLSMDQLDNRFSIIADQLSKRAELVKLARAEHHNLYWHEYKIKNAAIQLLNKQVKKQQYDKSVALHSMRDLGQEGLDIISAIRQQAKTPKKTTPKYIL